MIINLSQTYQIDRLSYLEIPDVCPNMNCKSTLLKREEHGKEIICLECNSKFAPTWTCVGIAKNDLDIPIEIQEWSPTEDESKSFLRLADLYFSGDLSVFRSDNPILLSFGLYRQNTDGEVEMAMMRISEIHRNHPILWKKFCQDNDR